MSSPSQRNSPSPGSSSHNEDKNWGATSYYKTGSRRGRGDHSLFRGQRVRLGMAGHNNGRNREQLEVRNRQNWLNIEQEGTSAYGNRSQLRPSFQSYQNQRGSLSRDRQFQFGNVKDNKVLIESESSKISLGDPSPLLKGSPSAPFKSSSPIKSAVPIPCLSPPGSKPTTEVGFGWIISANSMRNPLIPVLPRLVERN